ncbi:restriction endonuclease [Paenibacillus dendritiformis]|uniref:restriction endonuclease n=1 Tax=Paenibacillus dendritiformis TaxID=130049 RepID=UPI0031F5AF21
MHSEQRTPGENLEYSYLVLRKELAFELLQRLKAGSPQFFEKAVVELLVKMGYGGSISDAGKAVGKSGDGGIDGIIKEDRLGLDMIYIQAKRWEGVVGRPEIQKFVGALQGQKARKGVFITTSSFTKEALEYVTFIDNKVVLIDGEQLTQLMIDYNLGVSTVAVYEEKRIDLDFFSED